MYQVVGSKLIRLYPPSVSSALYPRSDILKNTSQVDVENPDLDKFPLFADVDDLYRQEVVLNPGQVLIYAEDKNYSIWSIKLDLLKRFVEFLGFSVMLHHSKS